MDFAMPKENSSDIKVIGVGGGGGNAVNHMFNQGIEGVDFIICNTDKQALDESPVPIKIQLGKDLTEGRGAGMISDVGMNAAMENIEDIRELLSKQYQDGICNCWDGRRNRYWCWSRYSSGCQRYGGLDRWDCYGSIQF